LAWEVRFGDSAKKELTKLDRKAAEDILKFLRERIATDEAPRRFGGPLRKNLTGLWKYRVGSFRIIADIQNETITVLVLRVAPRSKAYCGH
jgi:mRNA interferase RelE/StbE